MGDGQLALKGYRRERGLLWPDYDHRCAEVTFAEVAAALPRVLEMVNDRRVVVQAGGNCGQMVRLLAEAFEAVYTFEPDPQNFVALTINTAHLPNVFRYQAAVGACRWYGPRGMVDGDAKFPGANCGALYMAGEGKVPTIYIDDLGLRICDLMMLDVEGGERSAIESAEITIGRCRPVIVIEDKGLGAQFYGEEPHAAERRLAEHHGYRRAARIKNDTVMVPA
jgi:FkbM family methyltransferase